jgi:hypothetical protein
MAVGYTNRTKGRGGAASFFCILDWRRDRHRPAQCQLPAATTALMSAPLGKLRIASVAIHEPSTPPFVRASLWSERTFPRAAHPLMRVARQAANHTA